MVLLSQLVRIGCLCVRELFRFFSFFLSFSLYSFPYFSKKQNQTNKQKKQVSVKAGSGKEFNTIDPKSECVCILFNDYFIVARANRDKSLRVKHLGLLLLLLLLLLFLLRRVGGGCSLLLVVVALFLSIFFSYPSLFPPSLPTVHLEQCNKVTESETNGCVFTVEVIGRREGERGRGKKERGRVFLFMIVTYSFLSFPLFLPFFFSSHF